MQVANALNNQIRILFNPNIESFRLFDFLMVKSSEDRYIAQIIEIYDDKFDASQNVAKLKLFYKISKDNEVIPYDNFTPNKECEIVKIKQDEIEKFTNNNKKTFQFATNVKNSAPLNLQYDFFNNGAIILADKIDNANSISLSLAKQLSNEKNVVIIDSTGILEFNNIPKIKASKDFKIPLNYTTIDYVFEKCLEDASLEFQAIAGDILNEIKKFAKSQSLGFIPFNAFIKVLLEQYKATPYPELKVLMVKLKKYQMNDIFAKNKKDIEELNNSISKNKITIVDISITESMWQKAYLDYITDSIEDKIYLLTRINDENCDADLINKIYNNKKNINFIPNVSYNYKKLPTLMQYCKNYILLPSLYQRSDFLDANFALCNLITDGCVIFGENTDNFLYMIKNYEPEIPKERKAYRKIALSLLDENEKEEINDIDNQRDYFEDFQREIEQIDLIPNDSSKEKEPEEEQEVKNKQDEDDKQDEEEKEFEKVEDFKGEITNDEDEFQNLSNYKEEDTEEKDITEKEPEEEKEEKIEKTFNEIPKGSDSDEIFKEETQKEIPKDKEENKGIKEEDLEDEIIDLTSKTEEKSENLEIKDENISFDNMETIDLLSDAPKKETETEEKIQDTPISKNDNLEIDLSEDDLDFFQIAKESSNLAVENEEKPQDVMVDDVKYKSHNQEENDNIKKDEIEKEELNIELEETQENDIDLNDVAQKSIDESFEEIISTANSNSSQTINLSDDKEINIETLEENTNKEEKESLPIFKEKQEQNNDSQTYKVGDIISHNKYGKGSVVKTMKYENRQLLQIEFETSGKKLLDPKIPNVKIVQKV